MSVRPEGLSGVQEPASDQGPGIDCESAQVALLLDEIAATVRPAGARFAEGFTVRERAGSLSGHRLRHDGTENNPRPLIVLTDAALPRVKQGEWRFDGGALRVEVAPATDKLTARLLSLMAQLYSATGKPQWYREQHPRATLRESSAAFQSVRRLRPQFNLDSGPEGFLATRAYGLGELGEPVLLPIADALNHHHSGAQLRFTDAALRIAERHPSNSSECLVAYGGLRRDPLDLALHYGFADATSRVARSAPLHCDVAGLGPVRIGLLEGKPKSLMDPPMVEWAGGVLALSHLNFQADEVSRTEVPLRMLLDSLGVPDAESASKRLLRSAVEGNVVMLNQLCDTLDDQKPAEAMLLAACSHQVKVLDGFLGGLG